MRHALWPRGELGQILVCLQEAQSLAQALGDRHRLGWIAAFLAGQFGQIGEPDHALVASQRPLAIAEILGDASITVTAQQYLGQGYHSLGDYRRAEVAAHRHPPQAEQAEAYYRQSLALADELGMRPLVAHCHRGLGTLYAKIGRRTEAGAALTTAVELYQAMDMTFWLPQAEAALAHVAVGPAPRAS